MSPQRRLRRAPRAAALIGSTIALGLAGASAAQASTDTWGCGLAANGGWCNANRHSLVRVSNSNSSGLWAYAASSTTGNANNVYASWAYGAGYACHSYGGGNLLYPLIMDGSSSNGNFIGTSTYGSGAASC